MNGASMNGASMNGAYSADMLFGKRGMVLKEKVKTLLGRLGYHVFCTMAACEVVLLLHVSDILGLWDIPKVAYVWILLAVLHLLLICMEIGLKRVFVSVVAAALAIAIAVVSVAIGWPSFGRNGAYENVDQGKAAMYGNRRVMMIVPHQDDDINLLGGVIEEYVKYGSEMYVVFVTNGDYLEIPMVRCWEALEALGNMGVAEDHVIFLGYGDQYAEDGPHIYNAPPGQVVTSFFGRTETYGADFHPAYREGRAYTSDNFREDLQGVILEYRPDVLFCSDYDPHVDHKATSLVFDKVMGTILKENADYRPAVYKGYTYYTAWIGEYDYYKENIASTKKIGDVGAMVYRWEDGVRLPVNASVLSRSLLHSEAYQRLLDYASQNAQKFAERIINGDRVVWQRHTGSLCYAAEIRTSSGDGMLLNDFMLLENHDILDGIRKPYDGVWCPDAEDGEKRAEVILAEPSDLYSIVLYDHPSPEENVTSVEIRFDDGTNLIWETLDPVGAATEIVVQKEAVNSFAIRILSAEGTNPGLSEVEAFAAPRSKDGKLIKLMDAEGDFLYDYWISKDGTAELLVYAHGMDVPMDADHLTVAVSNPRCEVSWENETLKVHCPKGQETELTVSDLSGEVSDSVVIRNPGAFKRMANGFWQRLEKQLFDGYNDGSFNPLLESPVTQWVLEKLRVVKYYLQ